MIFSSPPQFGQCSRSCSNTRLSSRAQLSHTGRCCAQFRRGRGANAASRCMNSSGDITKWVVPSRQGVLSLSTHLPGGVALLPFFCPAPGG